jgi:hypothetical protein
MAERSPDLKDRGGLVLPPGFLFGVSNASLALAV